MITTYKHPARRDPLRSGRKTLYERWSSPGMFVLAATGAAIGFNNFWQFPSLIAQYGGGAFLMVYLLCVLVIGVPLLMMEFALGRAGRASPVGTFQFLARRAHADPLWKLVGGMGVISVFLILSYLSVIAGWVIAYTWRAGFGIFAGLTADGMNAQFAQLVKDPEKQLFWHALFIVMTMFTVGRGVRHGIQTVVQYAVPLLFLILFGLAIYALNTDAFVGALSLLFIPDFSKMSSTGLLAAMSHAFFSLGLGAGAMLMYGAYLGADTRVTRLSFYIVGADTLTGIVAAFVIFSVLFAANVDLSSGPSLVFQSLPLAFDHLPYGRIALTAFLVLLVLVAWVSAVALAEPVMVWLSECFGMSLRRSTVLCGVGAWILGIVTILSFNDWAFSFKIFGVVKKLGFFDVLQVITAQILLPLSGVFIAIFAGWVLKPNVMREALHWRPSRFYTAWLWLVRLIIPVLLLIIMFNLPELFA